MELMRASEKPDSGGSDSLLYFVRILFFFAKTRVAASDDLTNTVAGSLTNTDAGTAP